MACENYRKFKCQCPHMRSTGAQSLITNGFYRKLLASILSTAASVTQRQRPQPDRPHGLHISEILTTTSFADSLPALPPSTKAVPKQKLWGPEAGPHVLKGLGIKLRARALGCEDCAFPRCFTPKRNSALSSFSDGGDQLWRGLGVCHAQNGGIAPPLVLLGGPGGEAVPIPGEVAAGKPPGREGGSRSGALGEETRPLADHECICSYCDNCMSMKRVSYMTL